MGNCSKGIWNWEQMDLTQPTGQWWLSLFMIIVIMRSLLWCKKLWWAFIMFLLFMTSNKPLHQAGAFSSTCERFQQRDKRISRGNISNAALFIPFERCFSYCWSESFELLFKLLEKRVFRFSCCGINVWLEKVPFFGCLFLSSFE